MGLSRDVERTQLSCLV